VIHIADRSRKVHKVQKQLWQNEGFENFESLGATVSTVIFSSHLEVIVE